MSRLYEEAETLGEKMKTELQIAKQNINSVIKGEDKYTAEERYLEHKYSCERFLEFLETNFDWSLEQDICKDAKCQGIKLRKGGEHFDCIIKSMATKRSRINEKISDLKQAIKFYEDKKI